MADDYAGFYIAGAAAGGAALGALLYSAFQGSPADRPVPVFLSRLYVGKARSKGAAHIAAAQDGFYALVHLTGRRSDNASLGPFVEARAAADAAERWMKDAGLKGQGGWLVTDLFMTRDGLVRGSKD